MVSSSDDSEGIVKQVTAAVSEIAKAEQAQQKTAQELISVVRDTGAYLGPHFRTAVSELGGIVGDRISYWRLLQLSRMLKKVQANLDAGHIHPAALRQLSFGDVVRVLEAASVEETDEIQDLWARLIANAVKPDSGTTIKKVYVDLLKSMSPAEATLLNLLFLSEMEMGPAITEADAQKIYPTLNAVAERGWRRLDESEQNVAIQNLIRLRCITFQHSRVEVRDLLSQVGDGLFAERSKGVKQEEFEKLIKQIVEMIDMASGLHDPNVARVIPGLPATAPLPHVPPPELVLTLTPLGRGLMNACRA